MNSESSYLLHGSEDDAAFEDWSSTAGLGGFRTPATHRDASDCTKRKARFMLLGRNLAGLSATFCSTDSTGSGEILGLTHNLERSLGGLAKLAGGGTGAC